MPRALVVAAWMLLSLPCMAADITQEELRARAPASVYVLDVRTSEEFAQGHVPGAVNIPIGTLEQRLAEVPKDRTVVVYCESGRRAGRAEELLAASGRDVRHLEGDMQAWRKAKLEVGR